ncbi:MAG: HAD-IA family hydrolase [Novosphingobium sp.]
MNKFPYNIVGFDLDGTLVDSSGDLAAAVNHALIQVGRKPFPVDEIKPMIGRGARNMLNRALAHEGGISDEEFKPLFKELIAFYEVNIAVHTRPFPGCINALDALANNGCKLVVVTNKLESLARKVLDELDILNRFETVIGGDTMGPGNSKPSAMPIHEMIARCGGGSAAFVGDTSDDVGAARAAGIKVVATSFGYNDKPTAELGADAIIDHYDELVPLLGRGITA